MIFGPVRNSMPYRFKKVGNKVQIINKETGKVVGTSTSMEKAKASARARMAGEHGWKPKKRGK